MLFSQVQTSQPKPAEEEAAEGGAADENRNAVEEEDVEQQLAEPSTPLNPHSAASPLVNRQKLL